MSRALNEDEGFYDVGRLLGTQLRSQILILYLSQDLS